MALRNSQGQRKKYLTLELSSASNFVEDMCAIVSEFQSAKIGVHSRLALMADGPDRSSRIICRTQVHEASRRVLAAPRSQTPRYEAMQARNRQIGSGLTGRTSQRRNHKRQSGAAPPGQYHHTDRQ